VTAVLVSWAALVLPISLGVAVLTLAALPFAVARIPADYLLRRDARVFPASGALSRIALDVLGATLVLVGIALLVLPGQGLLAILTGLVFVRFPGKRKLVRSLLRRRSVLRPVNALRRRLGRPGIRRPEPGDCAPEGAATADCDG
jgi:Putative transmembrane protein (PGPGW)